MPKEKKTKKQKLRSDLRKLTMKSTNSYSLDSLAGTAEVSPKATPTLTNLQNENITTSGYTFLSHDLRKTLLVTLAIIVMQVVLHFFVIK